MDAASIIRRTLVDLNYHVTAVRVAPCPRITPGRAEWPYHVVLVECDDHGRDATKAGLFDRAQLEDIDYIRAWVLAVW